MQFSWRCFSFWGSLLLHFNPFEVPSASYHRFIWCRWHCVLIEIAVLSDADYHVICLNSWRFLNEYSPWFAVYLYNILILNALLITSITRVFAANAFLFSNEAVPERVFVKKISSRSWGGNGAVDTWCFQSCNAEEKQYVSEVYRQPVGQLQ